MNIISHDGKNALSVLFEDVDELSFREICHVNHYPRAYFIIDEDVVQKHFKLIQRIVSLFDMSYEKIYIGGEKSKNIEVALEFIDDMMDKNISRRDVLIAIGGGSVLDLAGFVAAIYKRGIDWYNIPTTLLACVDAGLGGKTAINTRYGKNMIGAFHMPKRTLVLDEFLKTLPQEEIYSGFGEIVKMAMLQSNEIYHRVIHRVDALDIPSYWDIIAKMGSYKLEIVERDFRDLLDIRAILNLGHSLGHAVEKLSSGSLKHGIAVMYGIDFALFVSMKKLGFHELEYRRYHRWLISREFYRELHYDVEEIFTFMKQDKKNRKGEFGFVCLEKIGKPKVLYISEDEMKDLLLQYYLDDSIAK